jgi:hypothetical protein
MASLVWLIVWIIQGTPNLTWFGTWNDWAVALLGCIVFDFLGGRELRGKQRPK